MAENGLSLQQRLADTVLASIDDLQEIAEEMFTRFYAASGTAAAEREKTRVLMQEIQRLEKENGRLRTELDNEQDKLARARGEVEKCAEIVKNQLRAVEKLKEENRVLGEENYKMETQIRQMVAKEAGERIATAPAEPAAEQRKIQRQTSPEDARPRNDSAMVGVVDCPRCGSMDLSVLPKNQRICCVCGEVTTYG